MIKKAIHVSEGALPGIFKSSQNCDEICQKAFAAKGHAIIIDTEINILIDLHPISR